MHRAVPALLLALGLLAPLPALAGVESHDQYRQTGPTRYVVAVWEVIHDSGVITAQKRTFKWKKTPGNLDRTHFAPNERSVLPGEWYGPITVEKHVDHLSWAGSYWRQDGAMEANIYEVEVREERPVGLITGDTYEVEVSFRLVKRPTLFQPNLAGQ
jgi:hypothetical protein